MAAAGIDEKTLAKKQLRNDAMLSVYQACSECKGAAIPGQAAAMPLNEAVKVLLDDELWDAHFIRQRALVRLLRAKVHHRHAYGDVVDRLADEVFCERAAVRKAVDAEDLDGPSKELACFDAMKDRTLGLIEQEKDFDLEKATPTTVVRYKPSNLISKVTGKVEVPGRPEDFARVINPRYWDECPDSQFAAAYEVDMERWEGEGTPPEKVTDDPPEKAWHGVFYEDVLFRMNRATQSRFKNLLHIDFWNDANGICACYRLYRALSNQLGLFERPGGIDVDHGFFAARPTKRTGWTEVEVVKNLRYTDATPRDTGAGAWDYGQTMNYLAPSLLGMWIEAVLTEIGEQSRAQALGRNGKKARARKKTR